MKKWNMKYFWEKDWIKQESWRKKLSHPSTIWKIIKYNNWRRKGIIWKKLAKALRNLNESAKTNLFLASKQLKIDLMKGLMLKKPKETNSTMLWLLCLKKPAKRHKNLLGENCMKVSQHLKQLLDFHILSHKKMRIIEWV